MHPENGANPKIGIRGKSKKLDFLAIRLLQHRQGFLQCKTTSRSDCQIIRYVHQVRLINRQVRPAVLDTDLATVQSKASHHHGSNATELPCLTRRLQLLPGAMQDQQVPFADTTSQDLRWSYFKLSEHG